MSPEAYLSALLGTGPLPAPPSSSSGMARWVRWVEVHGLEGLAVVRNRECGGALPPEVLARWEGAYRARGLATTVALEAGERARDVLAGAGVGSLLFKGAALVASGLYGDPGARRMDDADLLVREGEAEEAVEALREGGFEPITPWEPDRVGWVDSLTLRHREAPPGTEAFLDLHWRARYDRVRFGADGGGESLLWEGADEAAGFPAPGPHLVVVAEHVLKHLRVKVHLPAWADLARLSEAVAEERGGRGWERVEEAVAASRMEWGLRALFRALAVEVGAPVPRTLHRRASPELSAYLAPGVLARRPRPAGDRLEGLLLRARLLGSPGAVLADLREALLPPDPWLRARYGVGDVGGWARYVLDLLRWATYRGRSPVSPNQELFPPTARE